jgi:hypothetical protein
VRSAAGSPARHPSSVVVSSSPASCSPPAMMHAAAKVTEWPFQMITRQAYEEVPYLLSVPPGAGVAWRSHGHSTRAKASWGARPDVPRACAASLDESALQSGRLLSGAPAFITPISEPSDQIATTPSEPAHRTRGPASCAEGIEPKAKRDLVRSYEVPESAELREQDAALAALADVLVPVLALHAPSRDATSVRRQAEKRMRRMSHADRARATPADWVAGPAGRVGAPARSTGSSCRSVGSDVQVACSPFQAVGSNRPPHGWRFVSAASSGVSRSLSRCGLGPRKKIIFLSRKAVARPGVRGERGSTTGGHAVRATVVA